MSDTTREGSSTSRLWQAGFSLIELLVATVVLLGVSGIVMSGMIQMSLTQGTITNRTNMHSGVRNGIQLLQQEIGQAGRFTLPAPVSLTSASAGGGTSQTVGVSSTAGMFNNQRLIIDTGDNEETVQVTNVSLATNQITAFFFSAHAAGVPVQPAGAFASGIVPTNQTNGSTGSVLKLYGDINDDGNMVYVEYTCDINGGNLYRNVMSVTAASKPALTPANILVPNVLPNPDGTPCFTYQQKSVPGNGTFVLNVAVTLTVQTEQRDPQTKQFQTETKALLNVSPRNVFQAWQAASGSVTNRVQPMPPSVIALLPN